MKVQRLLLPFTAIAAATTLFFTGCDTADEVEAQINKYTSQIDNWEKKLTGDMQNWTDGLTDQAKQSLFQKLENLGLGDLGYLFDKKKYEEHEKDEIPEDSINVIDTSVVIVDTTENNEVVIDSNKIDLTKWLPAPRSQGQQGSCVGWATAAMKNYAYNKKNNIISKTEQDNKRFSPSYIYNVIKVGECSDGSYLFEAADTIQSRGIIPNSQFPYNDAVCEDKPSADQVNDGKENRIASYSRIDEQDIEQIKAWLRKGHLVFSAITVDDGFMYIDDETVYKDAVPSRYGHAIITAGFDEEKKAFLLYNSWGTDWGFDGKAWISYESYKTMIKETYVFFE